MSSSFRAYYRVLISAFAVCGFVLGASFVFLSMTHETKSVAAIADLQQKTGYFYSSGISDQQTHLYKLSLYEQIRPDIVALGSSRVLQFRGEDFKVPFVNMGLSMRSIEQGHQVVDAMLATGHAPRLVILGADFWWFADGRGRTVHDIMTPENGLSFKKLLEPYRQIVRGKLALSVVVDIIRNIFSGKINGYGLIALAWQDGYDKFGSRHYTSMVEGRRESDSIPGKVTAEIESGKNILNHQDGFDPAALNSYKALIRKFEKSGSRVLVIIPPNYSVLNKLAETHGKKNLIPDFRKAVRGLGGFVSDFHDHESFAGKCELLDGWHGGEVSYLRILRKLADKDAYLRQSVNISQIDQLIRQNTGQAAIHRSNFPVSYQTDFLSIGCAQLEKYN